MIIKYSIELQNNILYENRSLFIKRIEEIENSFYQNVISNQVCAIRRILNYDEFILWLNIF